MLKDMEKNTGAKGNPGGRGAKIVRLPEGTTHPALAEIGISKRQSSNWQKIAEISEANIRIEEVVKDKNEVLGK